MKPNDDLPLRFTCPQCVSPLRAPATAAGKHRRCPRCQFVFKIPHQTEIKPSRGEYPLQTGEKPESAATHAIYFTCPVCRTRLSGEIDEVGSEVVCPDCGTPAIVPPPSAASIRPKPASVPIGEYALREADALPAEEEVMIRATCPLCHTLIYASLDQVGAKIPCPDCSTLVLVPPAPPPRKKIDPMADAGEGYALDPAAELGPRQSTVNPAFPQSDSAEAVAAAAAGIGLAAIERPALPRQPFLSGTFSFPFAHSVWTTTAFLTVTLLFPSAILGSIILIGDSFTFASWFSRAILGAITMIVIAMWFVYASACGLTVIRATGNGGDQIANWPGINFIDYLGDPLYILNGICFGVAPGAFSVWLAGGDFAARMLFGSATLFLLFPILLLSTLEQCSPFGVFSWPIFRTLWSEAPGWLTFYLLTAMVFLADAVLVRTAFAIDPRLGPLALVLTVSAVWLIYCRLLGRLAWCCVEHARLADELDADDQD